MLCQPPRLPMLSFAYLPDLIGGGMDSSKGDSIKVVAARLTGTYPMQIVEIKSEAEPLKSLQCTP